MNKFKHGGKTYVQKEGGECSECSFVHPGVGCCAPEEIHPCWYEGKNFIWVEEVKEAAK